MAADGPLIYSLALGPFSSESQQEVRQFMRTQHMFTNSCYKNNIGKYHFIDLSLERFLSFFPSSWS